MTVPQRLGDLNRSLGSRKRLSGSLNSCRGGVHRDYIGTTIEVIKGDTGSSDYGSIPQGFSYEVLKGYSGSEQASIVADSREHRTSPGFRV